jgi:hypothetical protein
MHRRFHPPAGWHVNTFLSAFIPASLPKPAPAYAGVKAWGGDHASAVPLQVRRFAGSLR